MLRIEMHTQRVSRVQLHARAGHMSSDSSADTHVRAIRSAKTRVYGEPNTNPNVKPVFPNNVHVNAYVHVLSYLL